MGEFRMPSLGADMEQGILLEWLVKVGDPVRRGDIVAVVETPKSTVEVECFESGTVEELLVDEGRTVPVGTALARLGDGAALPAAPSPPAAAAPPAATPPAPIAPVAPAPVAPEPVAALATRARVSPLARRVAEEEGVDLSTVTGTGFRGAVRVEDVRRAAAPGQTRPPETRAPEPTAPETTAPETTAPETTAPETTRTSTDMRVAIARLMSRSNREVPHYHLTHTVDLSLSLRWMKERNRELEMSERLVPAALLLAATARAARVVPELNGHWVDDAFRPAADVDLGLILSLRSGGLLVPVIAGADRLTVEETMARTKELTRRSRSGRLHGSDLAPPSITVSNLGDQGVESVLGVIYPPQVALVGFGAVLERPWAVDGLLGVRPLVVVTLAGDHRATDGATGSRLLRTIDRLLQTPEEL